MPLWPTAAVTYNRTNYSAPLPFDRSDVDVCTAGCRACTTAHLYKWGAALRRRFGDFGSPQGESRRRPEDVYVRSVLVVYCCTTGGRTNARLSLTCPYDRKWLTLPKMHCCCFISYHTPRDMTSRTLGRVGAVWQQLRLSRMVFL